MGDPKKMSLTCGDDEPCGLNTGTTSAAIEVRIGLWRTGLPLTAETLARIDASLTDPDTGAKLSPSEKRLTKTGVVMRFVGVAQRRYLLDATEKDAQNKVAYEVVNEPIQVDNSRADHDKVQAQNVELVSHLRVTLRVTVRVVRKRYKNANLRVAEVAHEAPDDKNPDEQIEVRLWPDRYTRLVNASKGVHEFEVPGHRTYQVTATPPNQLILPRHAEVQVVDSAVELTLDLTQRCLVYYITIDSVENRGHEPNLDGLRRALAESGKPLYVELRWYAHLDSIDPPGKRKGEKNPSEVFALFFGGNYDEWAGDRAQGLGRDPTKDLTTPPVLRKKAKAFVEDTQLPIMSVCGSHQLMAYLWNEVARERSLPGALADSWESIGHIGVKATIADEISWRRQPQHLTWQADEAPRRASLQFKPELDEDVPLDFLAIYQGSNPISYNAVKRQVGDFTHKLEIPDDAIFKGVGDTIKQSDGTSVTFATFYDTHRDEVRHVPPQFERIVVDKMTDGADWREGEDLPQKKFSSLNQGMRLKPSVGGKRVLYSFQFHPEFFAVQQRAIRGDLFSKSNDGEKILHNFLSIAHSFWQDRHW